MERRRITIFDTTLRDGEQSPGIALQPAQKAEIAEQLERLGVDVIEAGFPVSSPGDFEGVREVARTVEQPTVAALARTRKEDVDAAVEAVADARRSRVHVFIATSAPAHGAQARASTPRRSSSRFAGLWHTPRGASTRCSSRPRTRPAPTRPSWPGSAGRRCRRARARSTCPTPSALAPRRARRIPARPARHLPGADRVCVSVHCHDDLGLAVANSLAGIEAGAGQVECTVNGIGERAGNAALEEIVMAVRVRAADFGARRASSPARSAAPPRSSPA